MKQIVIYTTDTCSFCNRVKGALTAEGLEYSEVNLTRDVQTRVELAQRTGMMTFPQVLVDGQLLGGAGETLEAIESGRLHALLAA